MQKIIEVKELTKSFKEKMVLNGVNLSVSTGEIYALLGSNGSGKTTMINIFATLLQKDSGQVVINGFEVSQQAANVREVIALTGQFAALDEILTGRENIELMARLAGIKNYKACAQTLLEKVSMTNVADVRVSEYSGGMKRRIDIAMGLVANRQVIFLDEPTTGLDPEARFEIYQIIENLVNSGVTIFLTTQYLPEAERLADKIAILHHGKIVAQGTLEELKKEFKHLKDEPSLEEIFIDLVSKKEVRV